MGNNKFEWTPELVAEFYNWVGGRSGSGIAVSLMMEFKKSKEPVPEWEILQVKDSQDCRIYNVSYIQGSVSEDIYNYFILSIKRLSDAEIFRIGDKISSHEACITDIALDDEYGGGIKLSLGLHGVTSSIKAVIKEKEPELQWFVIPYDTSNSGGSPKGWTPIKQHKGDMGGYADCQYFPDEESAKEWIKYHKPVLCLNDIAASMGPGTSISAAYIRLERLVKSKING